MAEIKVNGELANVLVGVKEESGSSYNRDYTISYYNYRQDPFFLNALKLIKGTVKEFENKKLRIWKIFSYFKCIICFYGQL